MYDMQISKIFPFRRAFSLKNKYKIKKVGKLLFKETLIPETKMSKLLPSNLYLIASLHLFD